VQAARRLLAQRHLALLLCAAALCLKLVIPTGYMVASIDGYPAITLCPASGPAPAAATGMHGGGHAMHHRSQDRPEPHAPAEMPCAFAALSAAVLDTIDPVQLALLIAFVLMTGTAAVAWPAAPRRLHLRPPLRGPPATA
jgi:hypothetical protein